MKPFVFFDARVGRWFITVGGLFRGSLAGYVKHVSAMNAAVHWHVAEPS